MGFRLGECLMAGRRVDGDERPEVKGKVELVALDIPSSPLMSTAALPGRAFVVPILWMGKLRPSG